MSLFPSELKFAATNEVTFALVHSFTGWSIHLSNQRASASTLVVSYRPGGVSQCSGPLLPCSATSVPLTNAKPPEDSIS